MALSESKKIAMAHSDACQKTLRMLLDDIRNNPEVGIDPRLAAIAATQFELGFMALNKAIANPDNGISTER